MIQDIFPSVYKNEYRPTPPAKDNFAILYQDGKILVRHGEESNITFPTDGELQISERYLQYLFHVDTKAFFLVIEPVQITADFRTKNDMYEGPNLFRKARPRALAFAGVTACSLAQWYESNRYCGRCGKPMKQARDERMLFCPDCGLTKYPTISPAVIVGVTHGDKLLMSKYAGRTNAKFALIAGFNEIGETIEETVHREVKEEVGIRIKHLKYYKSQPWPFSSSLLMGFFCELDGSDELTVDHNELAEAGWYSAEEVPEDTDGISLTAEMMTVFKQRLQLRKNGKTST